MSISRFQEKILSPGCMTVVGIGIAAVMIFGTASQCGTGNALARDSQARIAAGKAIGKVGDAAISRDTISRSIESAISSQMVTLGADQRAMVTGQAVVAAVREAALTNLMRESGVDTGGEALVTARLAALDQAIERRKRELTNEGKLKPNATPADLDKALAAETGGKSVATLRKDLETQLRDAVKTDEGRLRLIPEVAPFLLIADGAKRVTPTKDQIDNFFATTTVKRILLPAGEEAKAAEVAKELAANAKFEALITKYSKDFAAPGKSLADQTTVVTPRDIEGNVNYVKLLSVPVGRVSEPLTNVEGVSIYKVVSRVPALPKDFAAQREAYTNDVRRAIAAADLQKRIDDAMDGAAVKIEDPEFNAMWLAARGSSKRDAKMIDQALVAAKAAVAKPTATQIAAEAYLLAVDAKASLPGVDKNAIRADQIAALEAMMKNGEDYALANRLVGLLEAAKDPRAGAALVRAAQANATFDSMGQAAYAGIITNRAKLRTAKLITPEEEAQIDEELVRWREARKADEEAKKEQERLDAEARKAAAAAEADAKKNAGAKPSAPKPNAPGAPPTAPR